MVKYSLGMSSDDCGGLPEYSHFFSTMRRVRISLPFCVCLLLIMDGEKVLGITDTRQEIRNEIHDVLGIVESGYMEEQRRQLRAEKRIAKQKEREQYLSDLEKQDRSKRIESLLSIVGTELAYLVFSSSLKTWMSFGNSQFYKLTGAVTIPIVLASGLPFEITEKPEISFWHLTVGCIFFSVFFLFLLILWMVGYGKKEEDKQTTPTVGNASETSMLGNDKVVPQTPFVPRGKNIVLDSQVNEETLGLLRRKSNNLQFSNYGSDSEAGLKK